MKLSHEDICNTIEVSRGQSCEWIIEAPELFAMYVQELIWQKNGNDGKFTLSIEDKFVDMAKKMDIIMNPFDSDINEKKFLNKLYNQLEEVAFGEKYYSETQHLIQKIYQHVLQLEFETGQILSMQELDFGGLLKAMGVKYEVYEENFVEKLSRYMRLLSEVLAIKIIVCVNLRSYMTDEQMNTLILDLNYNELSVIFIENQERSCLKGIKRYIIDKDLCEI